MKQKKRRCKIGRWKEVVGIVVRRKVFVALVALQMGKLNRRGGTGQRLSSQFGFISWEKRRKRRARGEPESSPN